MGRWLTDLGNWGIRVMLYRERNPVVTHTTSELWRGLEGGLSPRVQLADVQWSSAFGVSHCWWDLLSPLSLRHHGHRGLPQPLWTQVWGWHFLTSSVTNTAICELKYVGFEADWSLHLGHITGKMARKLSVTRKSNGITEMVILYIYQDFLKLCAVCFFLWVCACVNVGAK